MQLTESLLSMRVGLRITPLNGDMNPSGHVCYMILKETFIVSTGHQLPPPLNLALSLGTRLLRPDQEYVVHQRL